jgi:hypothetical protein
MKKLSVILFVFFLFFAAQAQQKNIIVEFNNIFGKEKIELHRGKYANPFGENISIELLQYFITNMAFEREDGSFYIVPQDSSYFLIKESDPASKRIHLSIPEGKYRSIRFLLGIDSLRNTMPLANRKGVLDPAAYKGDENMYWGWNTGYIFFKMEGQSDSAQLNKAGTRKYMYHIGLYGGMNTPTINNIKQIDLALSDKPSVKVKNNKPLVVEINADIMQAFTGAGDLKIAEHTVVMVSPFSAVIANNYAKMFKVVGVK